jgi:hypothetical protein
MAHCVLRVAACCSRRGVVAGRGEQMVVVS